MTVSELAFGTQELARPEDESQLRAVWKRFRRHRLAVIGLGIAAFLALVCFVGPLLSPYSSTFIPTETFKQSAGLPPMTRSPQGLHILGTDRTGRDYLTRLMEGGRVSLTLAVIVVLFTMVLGATIGGISGFFGGWVDALIMRLVDFLLTLPILPIYLVLYSIISPTAVPGGSVVILGGLLILLGWMGAARLVRGMVLSLKNQEFTEASRAVGASDWRIIGRHMLPNALAPVLVTATLEVGGIIVTESSLSFLGYGVRPPAPSWGNMLQDVQGLMFTQPYYVFFPGMAIFLTSLSFNFIGDALRDALDPRLKL